ncbi:MAG: MATE family multidrug resistance protein [Planctomycetota bacterium]|jgi:MATE family multidrug resistance protein
MFTVPDMSAARTELRALLRLAIPIILTNLGSQLMNTVDTVMLGHFSKEALAAAGVGGVWVMGTSMFAMGLLHGMDPIVTQSHGARDGARAGLALQRGLVLALLVSLPLALAWTMTGNMLLLGGQSAQLAADAHSYLQVQIPSIPFFLAFIALRQYLQGRDIVRPVLMVTLLANVLNVIFNWVLIYGVGDLPGMGLVGAGIATCITRSFLFFGLIWAIARGRLHEGAWAPWTKAAWSRRGLGEILRFGIPTSLQMGLEIWAFGACTLMAGALGTVATGAHIIVLNLSSNSFMVPLGVALAACTRVGNLIGAGEPERARLAGRIAVRTGAGIMLVAAVIFLALRFQLPRLYVGSDELDVLALAAAILPVAAAFQVFDGFQVVGAGILRGRGDTKPAAWFNLVGYWVLALPMGYYLAFHTSLGLAGVWWGLALGLAIVAVCLSYYLRRCYGRDAEAERRALLPSAPNSAAMPASNAGQASSAD